MVVGQPLTDDGKAQDWIEELLRERESLYGPVLIRNFFGRDSAEQKWKVVITRIEILGRTEEVPEAIRWDYDNAIFSRAIIFVDQFREILSRLVTLRRLTLPDLPELEIEGRFGWYEYLPSNKKRHFTLAWPANHFVFRVDSSGNFPSGPLVSAKSPVFADSFTLIREHFDLDLLPGQAPGLIHVLLPNYLARLDKVTIGANRLSVTVEALNLPVTDLFAKIHAVDAHGSRPVHHDILFEVPTKTVPLDSSPAQAYVGLFSREHGELLDFRQFHVNQGYFPSAASDVQWEPLVEEELDALILQGENEHVEFKPTLREREDVAETVVAFANSSGGVILVGVDNRGKVIGYTEQDPENTVRNILRIYCEPMTTVTVEGTDLRDKPLVIIRVKEGLDKPYVHREKGVLVRFGSTDRVATRYELDAFYAEKWTKASPFQ